MGSLEKDVKEEDVEKNKKTPGDDLNKEGKKEEKKGEDSSKGKTSLEVGGEGNNAVVVGGNFTNSFINMTTKNEDNSSHISVEKLNAPKYSIGKMNNSQVAYGDGNIFVNFNDGLDTQALKEEYGRFFVIGLCFYHGLSVPDFLSVLDVTKKYLSQKIGKENKINFPSRHPKIKTLEEFDSERLAVTIKFDFDYKFKKEDNILPKDYSSVGDIFTRLVKKDYVSELFNYVSILSEIVETQPNNWEIRWRAAVGLGQISELDVRHVFNKLINVWAQDERAFVRIAVAYYYYYILSGEAGLPEGAQKFLLEILEKWADPKNFVESRWRYNWTVAAICEKIGYLKNDQAQTLANKYLEQVAGINHIRVADAVGHALVDWSIKEKFPQVFNLLVNWAERGSAGDAKEDNPFEIRCIIALITFREIVKTHYEILGGGDKEKGVIVPVDILKSIWEKKTKKENLWNGFVSIGVRYFDFKIGHYFFEMIENWTEIVKDTDFLIEFVSDWLKEIYIIQRPKHLENRLKNVWSKSKNRKLVIIAEKTSEKIKNSI